MAKWARASTKGLAALCLVMTMVVIAAAGCAGSSGPTTSISSTDATSAQSTAPSSLRLTEADSGRDLAIQAGGTITIVLKANPSTGYFWELSDQDPEASLIEQVGDPAFVPDSPGVVGAGGTQTFTFRAVDKGEMVITMDYFPPSGDKPSKTFQVRLTVQ